MKDSSIRLVGLFKEAGLINEADWQRAQKQFVSEGKSFGKILTSDALSLKTYKELLTYEIKLPFVSKPQQQEIQLALGKAVQLSYQELQFLLNTHRPDAERLIEILWQNKILTEEEAAEARDIISRMGDTAYDALLEREFITPEIIARVVEKGNNRFSRQNRLRLALEILEYNKLIDKALVQEILTESETTGEEISKIWASKSKLGSTELLEQVAKGLYLPTVNLRETTISRELLAKIPTSFLRRELFLPLLLTETQLLAAMPDPLLLTLSDTVSLLTGKYVLPYFALQEEIINKINLVLREEKVVESIPRPAGDSLSSTRSVVSRPAEARQTRKSAEVSTSATEGTREGVVLGEPHLRRIRTLVDSQSTVQLVNSLIETAIATRATDIHLEPLREGLRVRYRIDGKLHNIMHIPRDVQLSVISRIKVLANMDVTERRRPQDGHIGLNLEGKYFDFRVSSLPTNLGEKIVMRILEKSTVLKGLAELGLDKDQQAIMESLIRKPYGMILVTGPTGSGKTTTLYSALNLINKIDRNIVTIEDPVEYQLDGINQVQVDYNIDLTFASGLRSILRQDPDVILVGEIRDDETARIAIRAALTGHLVFSTLHANTTASALNPLLQMGIAPYLIASAVIGIVAQRLVRQICPKCKVAYKPADGVFQSLGLPETTESELYRGAGCDYCLQTGYYGRIGVFEILQVDDEIRSLILKRASEQKIFDTAVKKGMSSLMQSGVKKIFEGITTVEEVLENISLV
ncbi:MAG: ATPase, T2SS/T4P/T4SS family [Candidatus Sumerlaeia bacterium]|nr:ATPase, T2SS/T4P/T4SS family [Candidatus Sumerlaeia bacterium]